MKEREEESKEQGCRKVRVHKIKSGKEEEGGRSRKTFFDDLL